MPTRVLIALIAVLSLATAGCGGDDDAPAAKGPDATTPAAEAGDSDSESGDKGAGDFGSCDDIDQSTTDLLTPGMTLAESSDVPIAELNCTWEVAKGDGSIVLTMQAYDGKQFYSREVFGDSVELTDVDLCDDAFLTETMGHTLQVLDGERVFIFGSTQVLVDEDQRMSVEEGQEGLKAVAAAVTGC